MSECTGCTEPCYQCERERLAAKFGRTTEEMDKVARALVLKFFASVMLVALIVVTVVCYFDKVESSRSIIQLQTDNATQGQQIRINNKSILMLTEGFFDEYELTDEQVKYIIQKKKWGKKKK
jgi:hypothetical protein